ncbi:MAG: class II aldolase/adducin family protein [Nannocystaceae bacterium]
MAEQVEDGRRIRFALDYEGPSTVGGDPAAVELATTVLELDALGCCPVLNDGLAAGNGAARTASGAILVTPSGRTPGALDPRDLVEIVAVDLPGWRVRYRARDPILRPTSDTPLHLAVLQTAWTTHRPRASLHGHTLDDADTAARLGLPCSPAETVFSTPADYEATLALLRGAIYPEHQAWIRRGHGFIVADPSLAGALDIVRALLVRAESSK